MPRWIATGWHPPGVAAKAALMYLTALSELLQRMSDEKARYGLALPDNGQFRGLVLRLPALTWRLGSSCSSP